VSASRETLGERGLGSSNPNVRNPQTAVEAMDNGLLVPELAAGIAHVKSAKLNRRRVRRAYRRRTSRPPWGCASAPSSPRCSAVRCTGARWRHRWALFGRIHAGGDARRTAREYVRPGYIGDGRLPACDFRPCFLARLAGSRRGGPREWCWPPSAFEAIATDNRVFAWPGTRPICAGYRLMRDVTPQSEI